MKTPKRSKLTDDAAKFFARLEGNVRTIKVRTSQGTKTKKVNAPPHYRGIR